MNVTVAMDVITGIFNLDNLPALLSGFGAGALVICFLWITAAAGYKKRLKKQKDEREKLMSALGELIADADTISADFRCGELKWELFSKRLSNKVNEITRELRTNMHLFDVFFVKYVEIQANQYLTVLENPERRGVQKSEEGAAASDTGLRFTPVPDSAPAPEAAAEVQQPAIATENAEEQVVIEEAAFDANPVEAENIQQTEFSPEPIETEDIRQTEYAPEPFETESIQQAECVPESFDTNDIQQAEAVEEFAADEDVEFEELPSDNEGVFELPIVQQSVPAAAPDAPLVEPAPVPIAPAPIASEPEPEPEQDTWSEKSIEEYEAGFAQFEETGYFQISRVEDEQNAGAPEQAAVPPPVIAPAVESPPVISAPIISAPVVSAAVEDDEEEFIVEHNQYTPESDISAPNFTGDHILTETVCIDRVPLAAPPLAAPIQQQIVPPATIVPAAVPAAVPIVPEIPVSASVAPSASAGTAVSTNVPEDNQEDGITGDDIMDSIDSFFNLK